MKKLDKALHLILPLLTVGAILIIWAVMAKMVGSKYILPSVSETVAEFFALFKNSSFYLSFLSTVLRSVIAFLLSFIIASVFAILAFKSKRAERVVLTIISIIRALPTVAIVLLLLFWTNTQVAPVIVTMLVVMPTTYTQLLNALKSIDKTVVEAGAVDGADRKKLFFKVEFPQILPSVCMTVGSGLSLNFKLMVAAEVLAATVNSIGYQLTYNNYNLEIATMIALVLIIVIVAVLVELVFSLLSKKVGKWK